MNWRSPNLDLRHKRHTRRQHVRWIRRLVENDLHGHTLHDLHVVASRVLRWQQTETRAGSRLNTIDVSFENFIGIRIDGELGGLARLHVSDVVLFEMRGHPHVTWHNRHQWLSLLN